MGTFTQTTQETWIYVLKLVRWEDDELDLFFFCHGITIDKIVTWSGVKKLMNCK